MLVYYLNLLLILALAYPLCVYRPSRPKRIAYLCCTFLALFLLSAGRQGIGNDYYTYIDLYYETAGLPVSALFSSGARAEPGFLLLCKLLAACGLSAEAMYAVMALLCLIPAAVFLYRYSENLWLSVWLYVTLTFFYGTMNFIRQNLALSVLLLGYPLLQRFARRGESMGGRLRMGIGYVGVILAAACFHKTALIMLPVLLVCWLPLNRWIGGAYGVLALALYLSSQALVGWVTDYIYTAYKNAVYLRYGLSPVFLIIPALILLLMLLSKKKLEARYDDAPLLINLVFYSVLIWLFITRHMVLERFSLYLYIYALLLIPMAVELQRPDERLAQQLRQARQEPKKAAKRRTQELVAQLSARRACYYCLIGAVLIATFCYHEFGMHDGTNGFHGVFPYHSLVEALNRLP